MKFYSYKYKVKTDRDKAFDYFLQKEYIIKYFSETEKDEIEIVSDNLSNRIVEGEEIKLIFTNDESSILVKIVVEKIATNELINYHLYIEQVKELKEDDDELDEEEFESFVNKVMGQRIDYKIRFEIQKDFLLINEQSEVFIKSIWSKLLWKCFGAYMKLKQRKIHVQVEKELEEM